MDKQERHQIWQEEERNYAHTILEKVSKYRSEQEQLRLEAHGLSALQLTEKVNNRLNYLMAVSSEEENAILNRVQESCRLYGREFKESIFIMDSLVSQQLSRERISTQRIAEVRVSILQELMDNYVVYEKQTTKKIKQHKKENWQMFLIAIISIIILGFLLIMQVWRWLNEF